MSSFFNFFYWIKSKHYFANGKAHMLVKLLPVISSPGLKRGAWYLVHCRQTFTNYLAQYQLSARRQSLPEIGIGRA